MKNFSYLIILLFSITLASCGDINEFTPTVENPDAEWKLSHLTSPQGSPSTPASSFPESFKAKLSNNNRTLTITHNFHDDSRAWFDPNPTVIPVNTPTGLHIDIVYKQISNSPQSTPAVLQNFPWTHTFNVSEVGRGKYAKFNVKVRRTYLNSTLFGFDKVNDYVGPTE